MCLRVSQRCGVKAGGDQNSLASQPLPSQLVENERMLWCPWGTSVHAQGCSLKCCGDLVLWSPGAPPCVSPPLLTQLLHLPNICYSNTLQISGFFCQLSQTPIDGEGNLKRRLALTMYPGHCALEICSFSEAGDCYQECSVSLFVALEASFSLIKTHIHWKFSDSTALIFPPLPFVCTTFSTIHSFTPWLCRLCLTLPSQ